MTAELVEIAAQEPLESAGVGRRELDFLAPRFRRKCCREITEEDVRGVRIGFLVPAQIHEAARRLEVEAVELEFYMQRRTPAP
jgi:hypothetical protein